MTAVGKPKKLEPKPGSSRFTGKMKPLLGGRISCMRGVTALRSRAGKARGSPPRQGSLLRGVRDSKPLRSVLVIAYVMGCLRAIAPVSADTVFD